MIQPGGLAQGSEQQALVGSWALASVPTTKLSALEPHVIQCRDYVLFSHTRGSLGKTTGGFLPEGCCFQVLLSEGQLSSAMSQAWKEEAPFPVGTEAPRDLGWQCKLESSKVFIIKDKVI